VKPENLPKLRNFFTVFVLWIIVSAIVFFLYSNLQKKEIIPGGVSVYRFLQIHQRSPQLLYFLSYVFLLNFLCTLFPFSFAGCAVFGNDRLSGFGETTLFFIRQMARYVYVSCIAVGFLLLLLVFFQKNIIFYFRKYDGLVVFFYPAMTIPAVLFFIFNMIAQTFVPVFVLEKKTIFQAAARAYHLTVSNFFTAFFVQAASVFVIAFIIYSRIYFLIGIYPFFLFVFCRIYFKYVSNYIIEG